MPRYLLTAYMLLLSLTGPNPCCCTMARFASAIVTAVNGNANIVPMSCCRGQVLRLQDQQLGSDGSKGQHNPNPSGKHCKCEKSLCTWTSSEKLEVVVDSTGSWLSHLCLALSSPALFDSSDLSTETSYASEPPWSAAPSGREVRIAICSWRC